MYGLINQFRACDCVTLYNLHITYCMHMYGCELWNFNDKNIEAFRIAWRKIIGHGRSLENHTITQIYTVMITHTPNCMNGARTLTIHHDEAAPGLHRPTSTTRGHLL